MVRADANAKETQGHVPGIGCGMSAAVLIGDEQRAIGQLDGLAIAVAMVHEKAVILRRRNPRLASVSAEDQSQATVSTCVRTMQAHRT
jgi:hypothetical protein